MFRCSVDKSLKLKSKFKILECDISLSSIYLAKFSPRESDFLKQDQDTYIPLGRLDLHSLAVRGPPLTVGGLGHLNIALREEALNCFGIIIIIIILFYLI